MRIHPAVTVDCVCVCVLIEASFLTGLLLSDWSGAHLWLSLAIQSESLMEAVVVEACPQKGHEVTPSGAHRCFLRVSGLI